MLPPSHPSFVCDRPGPPANLNHMWFVQMTPNTMPCGRRVYTHTHVSQCACQFMVDSKLFVVYGGFWQVISFQLCKAQRNERKKQKQDKNTEASAKMHHWPSKTWLFFHSAITQDTKQKHKFAVHPAPMLKRSHARSPTTMLAWKRGWDTRLIGPSSRTPTLPWCQRIWEVWDTQDLLESSFPAKSELLLSTSPWYVGCMDISASQQETSGCQLNDTIICHT